MTGRKNKKQAAPINAVIEQLVTQLKVVTETWKTEKDWLEVEINSDEPDVDTVEAQLEVFSDATQRVLDLHRKFVEAHIENGDEQVAITEEQWSSKIKRESKILEIKSKKIIKGWTDNAPVQRPTADKGRKLPKLELPKFSGEVRDWLPYWSQFKEIHIDKSIANADKFQYLLQSTVEGSEARELVQSYPITAENYNLAVDHLQKRYGKEKLLVKVYVRDLLRLVIDNAKNEKISLSSLYVKLSAQLRALGSLGVTTDKCAAVVYPLVESCLPEEVLRAWQRDPTYKEAQEKDGEEELEMLITFLEREVGAEENIKLACGGLTTKTKENKPKIKSTAVPTAAALVAIEKSDNPKAVSTCLFCSKSHATHECGQADKMTMEEKKQCIISKKACFSCLRIGHSSKKCKQFIKCVVCSRKHCTIMCPDLSHHRGNSSGNKGEQKMNDTEDLETSTTNMSNMVESPEILLATILVEVQGTKKKVRTRALIDSGSQKSYILSSIAQEVGLRKVGEEKVNHVLFGGLQTQTTLHTRYKIFLQSVMGSFNCNFDVSDIPMISGDIKTVPNGPWLDELKGKGITLSDRENSSEIGVLIGADVAARLMTGEKHELRSGPVAVNTCLGWTLMGKIPRQNSSSNTSSMQVTTLHVLDMEVPKLWELDCLGITDPTEKKNREELEEAAMEHFTETVNTTEEGRFEVHLPFIEGHAPLPTNWGIAERRLKSATNSMKKENTFEKYDAVLKQWEDIGMIEKVPEVNADKIGHYLPHRAVFKPNSTTPIRPVFDASSKGKDQPSLNDCMEKGPNLLEQIPTVITKFRLNCVGVVADIRKAFQQISVAQSDRDFLRFLWWSDATCTKMQIYRHCRVVFGVSSSPFLLGATLKHIVKNASSHLQESAEVIDKCMYVDNLVTSVSTKLELDKLQKDSEQLLLPCHFDLRGWEHGPSEEDKDIPVLGLLWNLKEDSLRLDLFAIKQKLEGPITKRKILSIVHMIFDPVGFSSPVTVLPKTLIQETCVLKLGWDTELPKEMVKRFECWRDNLHFLEEVKIPRWVNPKNADKSKWSLHVFNDASKLAYATAVFLRVEGCDGAYVQLLQSKSRVAPLKKVTIPRLELLACVIGARLASTVKTMINMPNINTFYWTDSSSALFWIRNVGNWGVFVQRRVEEIRQLTDGGSWNHIPGEENPADLPSRGCRADQLLERKWWEGYNWISYPIEEWPKSEVVYNHEEIGAEMRKKVVSAFANVGDSTYQMVHQLTNYEDMLMYIHTNGSANSSVDLSAEDFIRAEKKLFKMVQEWSFSSATDKKLKKLPIIKDEYGMLRLKTRLLEGDFEDGFKMPIVLPDKSPVVEALIRFEHNRNSHAGAQTLLTIMRERFWILKGRRTINQAIRTCEGCQRFTVKSLNAPTPALPKERIQATTPFQITGVDLFGPLILKGGRKCWVALFTCAVYRAVHLEVVPTISTEDFLSALRRFTGRRGRPDVIYSDNGTNFVGSHNKFQALNWSKISRYGQFRRIDWRFNPPAAPWWGGWWERLVGVVKQTLRKVLGKASLTNGELATLLCDVEAVVNQRPLTYVSENPQDLVPLTPQLFLVGDRSSHIPEADIVDCTNMNKRLKLLQEIREHLRTRFRKEYLGQLANPLPSKEGRRVQVGDVVLIGHDGQKRLDWPLGKIIEVIPGKDGKIRVVRVKTESGEFLRPIQRIYPLEVPEENTESPEENESEQRNESSDGVTRSGRKVKIPRRLTYLYI